MSQRQPRPQRLENLPEPLRKALVTALIKLGAQPPTGTDSLSDESVTMMMESLRDNQAMEREDTRRPATPAEVAPLLEHAGPCRFRPGDIVRWNPDLYVSNYTFPKLDQTCVVTQVFDPAMHDTSEFNGNAIAVRNDIALAYAQKEGDRWTLNEYTFDSRRFLLVE